MCAGTMFTSIISHSYGNTVTTACLFGSVREFLEQRLDSTAQRMSLRVDLVVIFEWDFFFVGVFMVDFEPRL